MLNGDYYYLIVAYNESGFTSSNCVYVLVMIPPGLFILSSDFNISDIDGILNLKWSHSSGGDNYSIYVHNTTISELTGIEILLAEGIKSHQYQITGLPNGDYFFVVIAINKSGNTISNCIQIKVDHPDPGQTISFGSFYLVFTIIGLISLVKKLKKIKKKKNIC